MVEVTVDPRRVFLGRDAAASRRTSAGAAVLWAVSFGGFAAAGAFEWVTLPVRFYFPMLATMLLASAANAVRNDGLLASVALATAPAAGYYASLALFELSGPVRLSLVEAGGLSLLIGVPVGVVGYLVGRGAVGLGSLLQAALTA
ncbi:hypothetical protein [Halobaculum gomorrense]|uniref:Uncharacterized protein n=1 Tax=Halobaculum gomorrense TaxID=43928 RepID=A0A1M5JRY5_9EURY|nr:hypothetical protein [Halobaculum gomorrense]SHG43278.1 hypothetical protein SAMN05443636_0242 [Halobaculum gomorrense]